MADRAQVTLNLRPQLNPVATVTETFKNPGKVQDTGGEALGALAGALQDFEPSLKEYFGVQQKIATAQDIAAGQQAYLKAKSGLKDAVDKGLIPAGMSPAFRRGYQQQQLRAMGLQYDQGLRQAYAQSDVQNSDDPNAMNSFMQDYTSKFLEENAKDFDPIDVSEILIPSLPGYQANLGAQHVAARAKAIEEGHMATTEVIVSQQIDAFIDQGDFVDTQQAGAVLQDTLKKALENGGDMKKYNQMVVDQVIAKAKETGDIHVLDILNNIQSGPGGSLGRTTYAREKMVATEDSIAAQKRAEESFRQQQLDRAKAERADALYGQAIKMITSNPAADVTGIMNSLSNVDPSKASAVLGLREAMLSSSTRIIEDPETHAQLLKDLDHAQDETEAMNIITSYAHDRKIDSRSVMDFYETSKKMLTIKPTWEKPFYKEIEKGMSDQLSYKDALGNDVGAPARESARRQLKTAARVWIAENQKGDGSFNQDALEMYLDEQSDKIVSRLAKRQGRDEMVPAGQFDQADDPFAATQTTQ